MRAGAGAGARRFAGWAGSPVRQFASARRLARVRLEPALAPARLAPALSAGCHTASSPDFGPGRVRRRRANRRKADTGGTSARAAVQMYQSRPKSPTSGAGSPKQPPVHRPATAPQALKSIPRRRPNRRKADTGGTSARAAVEMYHPRPKSPVSRRGPHATLPEIPTTGREDGATARGNARILQLTLSVTVLLAPANPRRRPPKRRRAGEQTHVIGLRPSPAAMRQACSRSM